MWDKKKNGRKASVGGGLLFFRVKELHTCRCDISHLGRWRCLLVLGSILLVVHLVELHVHVGLTCSDQGESHKRSRQQKTVISEKGAPTGDRNGKSTSWVFRE